MLGRLVVFAAMLAVAAQGARAADIGGAGLEAQLSGATDTRIERVDEGDFRGVIGGGIGAANKFIGSDDFELAVLPLLDVEWRGSYFLSTQRGLGLNFIRRRTLLIGPRLTLDQGRDSEDNSFLLGMKDIDPSIEAGIFLIGFNGPWRVKADLRQGLPGGHEGVVGSLDIAIGTRSDQRTSFILGGTIHWASANYAESYFGVSAAEATAARPAFTVDSGFQDLGGYLNIVFNFSDRVFVSALGRAAILVGSAADSPISQTDTQFFTGTVLGYRF